MLQAIDTGKQANAVGVIEELRRDRRGGIPWMVVLTADGRELVSSDGPDGNVGCPAQPGEIAWFHTMLERTRQRLSDADLATIQRVNEEFAARWRAPQRPSAERAKRKDL